eukprot:g13195.t1
MPGPFALLVSMFLLIGPAFMGLAGVTPPLRVNLDGEAVEVDEVVAKILQKNRRATQEDIGAMKVQLSEHSALLKQQGDDLQKRITDLHTAERRGTAVL